MTVVMNDRVANGGDRNLGPNILLIEDSPEFQVVIESVLTAAGYQVHVESDGKSGLERAKLVDPVLVVLDLGLPDLDGLAVCEELRSFTDAYVLMLSGRDTQEDKYLGLTIGADDYITKPFAAKELLLRIEVLLRRPRTGLFASKAIAVHGDLRVDRDAHQVWIDDQEVSLTKIEFAMLSALIAKPDVAHERKALALEIWGPHWVGEDHVINVHMANLRKKIDADAGGRIGTVRGIGYRLQSAKHAA